MFALRVVKVIAPKIVRNGNGCSVPFGRKEFHRWLAPTMWELKRRREKIGPDPPSHRSSKINWNYNAELYAFGKRLNEEFQADTLRRALTHGSYIVKEEAKRKAIGMTDVSLGLTENSELALKGEALMKDYILGYLRLTHPILPEEGIRSVYEFLVSEEILGHVSFNVGTSDLILCEELKPTKETLAKTFKAIVGAIAENAGVPRAELFVQDFLLTQLVGRDVNDLWPIVNPMGLLVDILQREGRELPESRLIRESGSKTIKAVYNVGIYSAKKLIGMGPGETVTIAEEMAARDALKRLFRTELSKGPLPLGSKGHQLNIPKEVENLSISSWTSELANRRANHLLNS